MRGIFILPKDYLRGGGAPGAGMGAGAPGAGMGAGAPKPGGGSGGMVYPPLRGGGGGLRLRS